MVTRGESTDRLYVPQDVVALVHSRQHISPKRLGNPGPSYEQVEKILSAAGAAPDHGCLTPWRLIVVTQERRHLLGDAFAEALSDRDTEATDVQKQEAREKAFRGPFLLLVVARMDAALGPIIPLERVVSAGCAIQNMLLVAYSMGFGTGLSSGRSLRSQRMRLLFKLGDDEEPLCFVTIGTEQGRRAPRARPVMNDYTSFL